MSDLSSPRLSIGVPGLDNILLGGLISRRTYLVRGGPGSGKTTLCLHFLAHGLAGGEKGLFISLGEAEEQIRFNAGALGIDVARADFLDLSPTSAFFRRGGKL